MNYQHIARLVELADAACNQGVKTAVEVSFVTSSPSVTLAFYKMVNGKLDSIYMRMCTYVDHPYTLPELIQILEQIEHYGFREQEQAA